LQHHQLLLAVEILKLERLLLVLLKLLLLLEVVGGVEAVDAWERGRGRR
jgi:hypothetical protein